MWPAAAWRLPRRRLLAGLDAEIALLLLERERHAAGGAHVAAGQALRAHRRAVELPAVVRRHARALELARHLRLVAALVGEALPLERHARVREALRLALEHPGAGAWGVPPPHVPQAKILVYILLRSSFAKDTRAGTGNVDNLTALCGGCGGSS